MWWPYAALPSPQTPSGAGVEPSIPPTLLLFSLRQLPMNWRDMLLLISPFLLMACISFLPMDLMLIITSTTALSTQMTLYPTSFINSTPGGRVYTHCKLLLLCAYHNCSGGVDTTGTIFLTDGQLYSLVIATEYSSVGFVVNVYLPTATGTSPRDFPFLLFTLFPP